MLHCVLVQRLLQRFSSPMQPTHYRADGNVEHVGDFFVVKPLHIGQEHRQSEGFREGVDRSLHLGVGERFQGNVFGGAIGFNRF
jgi:hypothetical protein